MPNYVTLANFTEQGIRNVGDTVKRADAFKELAKSKGVTVNSIHWTLGAYDLVVTLSGDDTAVTALGLALGKQGNVRTQTLRAFDAKEMAAILAKV